MPLENCHMCTWGERVLLHSYHDCQLFVCDLMEANGAMTVVPHAPPASYWGSSPLMMHVDSDTLFTSGGQNGDFNTINLWTSLCQTLLPHLLTARKGTLANEYLWV